MNEYVVCQDCANKRKWIDLIFCTVAGWWSPHGFLTTPFFVVFNVLALLRRPDPTFPSERFYKRARLNLARHLANQHVQTLIKQIAIAKAVKYQLRRWANIKRTDSIEPVCLSQRVARNVRRLDSGHDKGGGSP